MLMKTDRELDSLFKSTFNEFTHEIPSEVFMDDLDSRLSKSKSKRTLGYWKWYLSGLVIIISIVGWSSWNIMEARTTNEPVHTNLLKEKNEIKTQGVEDEINEITKKGNLEVYRSLSNEKVSNNVIKLIENNKNKQKDWAIDKVLSGEINLLPVEPRYNNLDSQLTFTTSIIEELNLANSDTLKKDSIQLSKLLETISSTPKKQPVEKKWKFSMALLNGVSHIYSRTGTPTIEDAQQLAFTSSYTQEDLKDFVNHRKSIESAITSWDMSIRMEAKHGKLVISSGLDLIRWGERISFGDTLGIEQLNTYSYLNLPLNIGFNYTFHKWQLQPYMGVSLGISINNAMGDYVIFNDPSADYMVSNYRANKFSDVLQSGCLIEYLSTSGYKVMLNPTIRTSISNIVEDGLIKTAYSSFGLQLGVGYQW